MQATEPARRTVLTSLSGAALLAALPMAARAETVPWSAGDERPRLAAPPGATDCHHHIYDSRFPADPRAALRPGNATVADYRLLQLRLGTTRNVVVQPSTYGTDNRCMLAALAAFGATARGIAVVDTTILDHDLDTLHEAGVRGIRFNLVQAGATTIEMVEPLAIRVSRLGWHVQIHMLADQIAANAALFGRLPTPLVFDHMARIPGNVGTRHPAFAAVSRLIEQGRTWVKLSGAYMDSSVGPPSYADRGTIAKAFVALSPDRMVWGSDWPHPTEKIKPDDAILFDLLADWAPDAATRNRMLVANPAALYGFPAAG